MNHLISQLRRFPASPLFVLLTVAVLASGATAAFAETDNSDERKAKILANLELQYPQIGQLNPQVGNLEPSGYEGLDQGTFTVTSQRGAQEQRFFVTTDDTKLYLLSGEPVDVSRSTEEIQAELDARAAAAAKEAEERMARLDASIEGLPFRGPADAAVTIVEFSDFQCPYCARGAETMEQLLEKYPEDVKLVFKHFPLGFHQWAKPAAVASHCAGLQSGDAFWSLHDKYFEHQKELTPENVLAKSKEYLAETGIDMEKWSNCAENQESEEYKAAAALVDADMAFGQELGVSGTPGFFVNGEFLNGAQPLAKFEPLVEAAKSDS